MRICFYTETALPKIGGQQIVVDRLAREISSLGHPVTLLTQPPRKPLVPDDVSLPYRVVRHPRYLSTTHLVGFYQRYLLRLHQQERFDLIHCHSLYPTGWIASLAKDRLGLPLVLTSHGGDVREGGLRLRKPRLHARYEQAVRSADALVAISRFTHEGFLRFDPHAESRIADIPNGVDFQSLSTPVPRPPELDPSIRAGEYIFYLGRLTRQKGVDTLLNAVPLLEGGVEVVVTGAGPEGGALRGLGGEVGGGRVRFTGAQSGDAKAWLLQNALCTVIPSREYEAFGLVALESFAAGRPVIASNLPGLADLVRPEIGQVVPPDSPSDLAAAINRMLANRAITDAMGAKAREVAREYDWRRIALRHVELYQRLLTPSPAARLHPASA